MLSTARSPLSVYTLGHQPKKEYRNEVENICLTATPVDFITAERNLQRRRSCCRLESEEEDRGTQPGDSGAVLEATHNMEELNIRAIRPKNCFKEFPGILDSGNETF